MGMFVLPFAGLCPVIPHDYRNAPSVTRRRAPRDGLPLSGPAAGELARPLDGAAGTVRYVWMHGHDLGLSVAENYRAFADDARGRSPLYESLAVAVAGDGLMLRFLGSLPPEKRQPNLLFAAARYLGGEPASLD